MAVKGLENVGEMAMPDVGGAMVGIAGAIQRNATKIYIGIVIALIVFILFKLSSHRVRVVKLSKVEGGFVRTTGRYRLVQDKNTKRLSFQAAFGGEKLPAYDSKYFQKMAGGFPFISAMRTITLVFLNKYSPVVCDTNGGLVVIDNKRWYFDTHKAEFVKRFNKGNLAYFLAIYAPLMIIIGAISFWIVTVIMQINILGSFGDMLKELVRRLGY